MRVVFASRHLVQLVAALVVVSGTGATAQPIIPADAILARPTTPGTVALLVEHANVPAVQARLGSAIRDSNPSVRAAAARVLFVTASKSFAPQVTLALASETSADAAIEQARFLVHFGSLESRTAVQAAWPRLGPRVALSSATAMGAVEGPSALDRIPALTAAGVPTLGLDDFIRVAARGEREPIERLLLAAIKAGDGALAQAALQAAAGEPRVLLADSVLHDALDANRPAPLRLAAARYLTRTWDGIRPVSPATVSGAIAVFSERLTAAEQAKEPTHALLFGRELLARASGEQPSRSGSWNKVLETADTSVQELAREDLALKTLSPNEIDRIVRRMGFARARQSLPIRTTEPRERLQVLDGYPAGFSTSVFDATACRHGEESGPGRDGVTGGVVTLREQGRVANLALLRNSVGQAGCQTAGRILLETFVENPRSPIRQGEERTILIPFAPSLFECQDTPESAAAPVAVDVTPNVVMPRKTRNVPPIYPPTAISQRVQGVVVLRATITSKGCVSTVVVVSGMDPRLDWASIQAVLGWRFTPAQLNGSPVPAIMALTVLFTLS